MKVNQLSKLFFYLAIIVAILATSYQLRTTKFENAFNNSAKTKFRGGSPMGNVLATYIYFLGTDHDPEIYTEFKANLDVLSDQELINFYSKLNWDLQTPHINYEASPNASWQEYTLAMKSNPNFLQFWQTMRPSIKSIYSEIIQKMNIDIPIVHFRCSDSPFNKHHAYHLTKASSVKWMANKVKERGYNKVIMLSCNLHHSWDKNSCQQYIDFYADVFKEEGVDVQLQCNSIVHDFSMMVNAPLLVTLNVSSFSFMAGIAKDPQNYISCNMGKENKGKYYLQTEADWILDPQEPLLHAEVPDYNDPQSVINKLAKS